MSMYTQTPSMMKGTITVRAIRNALKPDIVAVSCGRSQCLSLRMRDFCLRSRVPFVCRSQRHCRLSTSPLRQGSCFAFFYQLHRPPGSSSCNCVRVAASPRRHVANDEEFHLRAFNRCGPFPRSHAHFDDPGDAPLGSPHIPPVPRPKRCLCEGGDESNARIDRSFLH